MSKNLDYVPLKVKKPLDTNSLPKPVFAQNSSFLKIYWKSWELAWEHVLYREDSPQKQYIDEAMTPDTLWIWDTLFMALFCKYNFTQFPGIESLNNFYYIIHDKKKHPAHIQHPDNPPFFAWVEYEYAKLTGDLERLKWVIQEKKYLQNHFNLIEKSRRYSLIPGCNIPMMVKKTKFGYTWSGTSSGMDNTPRARGKYWNILWIDLISQQALSAFYISHIASLLGDASIQTQYFQSYLELKKLVDQFYWNEEDGIYYDINRFNPHKHNKVMTPASYWALLAKIANEDQAQRMVTHLQDPNMLGGFLPWPSIARTDKDFLPQGQYWRGSVWVPTSYMGTKGLEKYGYFDLARSTSHRLLDVMNQTFDEFEPHTIWEAYSPIAPQPATYKGDRRLVRPDFCGWSALAPISMFIENIIGLYSIDAFKKEIRWNLEKSYQGKQGIQRLRFGNVLTDIVYEEQKIEVRSNQPYSLVVNEHSFFDVHAGKNSYDIES
ncbi:MAG: alpha,alpha-trehalase [Promethearchaeota archaeon]|nr:MAG: alpha,alpha-trehalase [Candidatus Lokiarchaeota archaeon]